MSENEKQSWNKRFFIIVMLMWTLVPALLIGFLVYDGRENRGFTFGYYGDYNAITNALGQMTEISEMETFCHEDLFLEEIWFTVQLIDGTEKDIFIGQNESIRNLRHEELTLALRERINTTKAKPKNPLQ